jgi:hypothetical protein
MYSAENFSLAMAMLTIFMQRDMYHLLILEALLVGQGSSLLP